MLAARWGVRTAAVPWLVARLVVLAALGVAHELASDGRLTAQSQATVHAGLLSWDAGWYEAIAKHGYGGAGAGSLRFFPLVPLVARAAAEIPGVSVSIAIVAISNLSALAAVAALCCLVRFETRDDKTASRAAWLVCLAPPAFTFVMGYAEATFLFLSVCAFFALRRRNWWWAALFGLAAGLTRPIGALLAVPAVIEVFRNWDAPGERASKRLASISAILAGPAGCGAFMAYVGTRYGDAFAPLRIQEEAGHRGPISDPLNTLAHDGSLLVHGHHLGTALHLPWVVLAVVLLIVAAFKWPSSYWVYAFCILGVALTASNLDSFERYALSAFPLVLAGALLVRSRRTEKVVLVLSAAGLMGYALLAFVGLYVP
jgi:Mannosyltransferase (PIG-V)